MTLLYKKTSSIHSQITRPQPAPQNPLRAFIKSRLDYDPAKVGYSWDPNAKPYQIEEGYLFQSNRSPAISNKGHDTDIMEGDRTYKLDWTDNEAGALAIIEYLKTL